MRSGIKKLIKSVVFLCILSILIMKAGYYLRPMEQSSNVFRDLYSLEKDSADVALIGSSALYRFWIPAQAYDEQGITSCMGYCAAQDVATIPYVMEEILKTQDPEVIVIECRRLVHDVVFNLDNKDDEEYVNYFTEVVTSGMLASQTKYQLISDILNPTWEEMLEYMIPILKYHENIYEVDYDKLQERAHDDIIHNINSLQIAKIEKLSFTLYGEDEYPDIEMPEEYLKQLDVIEEKAQEYGKKVVFMFTPYASSARGQKLKNDLIQYMELQGYEYLDMVVKTEEMGLDFETDFYNGSHTNISGAKKVTSYMADWLSERYELETDHSSSVKAFWEQFVSEWKEYESAKMEIWKEKCEK